MDSETLTMHGDVNGDSAGDVSLAPYRSWALQNNVISMLGGDTAWRGRPVSGDSGDEHSATLIRGNGALIKQLEPDPDYRLRIRSMAMLLVAALALEAFNHFTSVGIKASDENYFVISGLALFALAATLLVFPRLTFKQFIVCGQLVLILAYAMIAIKCAGTGGVSSPYAVLWVFVVLYVAYFVARRRAIWNLVAVVTAMLLPFTYDDSVGTDAAVYLSVLLAASMVLAYSVMAGRELTLRAERAVRYLALADPLSGVANLRSFETAAEDLMRSGERQFALVLVDVNGLKGANAAFGYEVGDDMLRRLAGLLCQACDERGQVARIRGDEFAVLLPGAGEQEARRWLERFESLAARHNEWARGRFPRVDVATGAAFYPGDGTRITQLSAKADRRMFEAKSAAVRPPYEVDAAAALGARQLLQPEVKIFDPRRRQLRKAPLHSGVRWLLTGFALIAYSVAPDVPVESESAVLAIAAASVLLALGGFAAQLGSWQRPYLVVSDVCTLLVILPVIWTTGGWQSPLQPAMIFPVAFYAQFMAGRHAFGRVAIAVSLYTAGFWLSDAVGAAEGQPGAAARTLFLALLTALVLITVILQRNRRATDAAIGTIRASATFDPLTGVLNVHAFRADLEAMIEAAGYEPAEAPRGVPSSVIGHQSLPALIVADVDEFRVVNKRSGHLVGDAVLKTVAERLRKTVGDTGTVYRIDSDEFAVLVKVDTIDDVGTVEQRLRGSLDRHAAFYDELLESVSVSFGRAVWLRGTTAAELVDRAKAELARAQADRGTRTARSGGATLL